MSTCTSSRFPAMARPSFPARPRARRQGDRVADVVGTAGSKARHPPRRSHPSAALAGLAVGLAAAFGRGEEPEGFQSAATRGAGRRCCRPSTTSLCRNASHSTSSANSLRRSLTNNRSAAERQDRRIRGACADVPIARQRGRQELWSGLPTIGCGAQRDLVFARARETRLLLPPSGTQRTRILEPLTPRTGAPASCSGGGVSDSESAGENLDRGLAVARLPGFYATGENGAIVPLTDAVQEMHLDLVRPVLHAKARRRSQKLEQVVSQINGINSQTHRRSSHAIGPQRPQSDRLHEGRLFARFPRSQQAATAGVEGSGS
jgi:hypothetical protein